MPGAKTKVKKMLCFYYSAAHCCLFIHLSAVIMTHAAVAKNGTAAQAENRNAGKVAFNTASAGNSRFAVCLVCAQCGNPACLLHADLQNWQLRNNH
jgi:hypothetical protein